jgi:hypothetical protein
VEVFRREFTGGCEIVFQPVSQDFGLRPGVRELNILLAYRGPPGLGVLKSSTMQTNRQSAKISRGHACQNFLHFQLR